MQITTGKIIPKPRDWTSGPDEYELEIGNIFRYSKLLFDKKGYFKKLSKKYLPYYSEKVRKKKLVGVLGYMNNNLDHIEIYVKRGLYFHAFSRFYSALREFLQALFISKKIYPIAYDKHIKEQFYDILKMPKFYEEYKHLYEIKKIESEELIEKTKKLKELSKKYIQK